MPQPEDAPRLDAPALDPKEADALVASLAERVVAEVAPAELPLFPSTSKAYFSGGKNAAVGTGSSDDMLGFGVDVGAAVVLATPVILEVTRSVVTYVATELTAVFKEEAGPRIRAIVHHVLGPRPKEQSAATKTQAASTKPTAEEPGLTREQLAEVRAVAIDAGKRCRLAPDRAAILADAIVGSLVR